MRGSIILVRKRDSATQIHHYSSFIALQCSHATRLKLYTGTEDNSTMFWLTFGSCCSQYSHKLTVDKRRGDAVWSRTLFLWAYIPGLELYYLITLATWRNKVTQPAAGWRRGDVWCDVTFKRGPRSVNIKMSATLISLWLADFHCVCNVDTKWWALIDIDTANETETEQYTLSHIH